MHFTPTSRASYRPFPTASEDCETLGSRDTIDPADLVPTPGRTMVQPDDSDATNSCDDSTDTEFKDIEDDDDSDGT